MQVLLILILSAATLVLCWMALSQMWRRRELAQLADGSGLRFLPEPTAGFLRRYGECELMRSGHSGVAENVLFGRLGKWHLRAFDYHLEAGHGTQRLVRSLSVVAVEGGVEHEVALAWRGEAVGGPFPRLCGAQRMDRDWLGAGALRWAKALMKSWPASGTDKVSIQVQDGVILFAAPALLSGSALALQLEAVESCMNRLVGELDD